VSFPGNPTVTRSSVFGPMMRGTALIADVALTSR
jgi:hypothetical protein